MSEGDGMSNEISTKRLWEILIHDVFDTYTFRENKWKPGKYDSENIVGPTYFHDRKGNDCPFNGESVNRFQLFYKAALDEYMKKESKVITQRMCEVFRREFDVALDFLRFYDDDTTELREAKRTVWLMIIGNLAQSSVDVTSVSLKRIKDDLFWKNHKFMAWIGGLSQGTYTWIVLQNLPKSLDEERECEDEYSDDKVILRPIGIPIFLFDYSGTMAHHYIEKLKNKSKYKIECLRTITDREYHSGRNIYIPEEFIDIFLTSEEFERINQQGDLFCIRTYSLRGIDAHTAFSKKMISDMLYSGSCICVSGDLEIYQEFVKLYPQTIPILLLNKDDDYVLKNMVEGVSWPGAAVRHIYYLCDVIDRIINEVPNTILFVRTTEDYGEIVKDIDDCIDVSLHRADYNAEWLSEYRSNLNKKAKNIRVID